MKFIFRHRLLAALAAAVVGAAAGMITISPTGCASDCGSGCPPATAIIESRLNVDPGIQDLAFSGPACPNPAPDCRGDGQTTLCSVIGVTAQAEGYCDVFIKLAGREPMAIHLEFGPAGQQGCCKGYPVVGDWHFTLPIPDDDGGIYGGKGNTDAVRIVHDGGSDDAAGDDAGSDGSAD
jgi:hypothetical protein